MNVKKARRSAQWPKNFLRISCPIKNFHTAAPEPDPHLIDLWQYTIPQNRNNHKTNHFPYIPCLFLPFRYRPTWFWGRLMDIAVKEGLEKRRYLLFASHGAAKSWGSVKQITVHYAMDFCLRARKKTQLYRGTARLSDTAIEQKYKQNGQINV